MFPKKSIILIFLIKLKLINSNSFINYNEINYLTNEFSVNFKENYNHVLSNELNPKLENEINIKIDEFIKSLENQVESDIKVSQIRKRREMSNLIKVNHKDGVYILAGFKEIGSIPVNFPKDICIFNVKEKVYAVALALETPENNGNATKTMLEFFEKTNEKFIKLEEYETHYAQDMDCATYNNKGYVTIVNLYENETNSIDPSNGSPIFEITANEIKVVQILRSKFLKSIRFWVNNNEMYLMKAFHSDITNMEESKQFQTCPVYKWMGYHFDILAELSCENAMRIEPFFILSEFYIAIANYEDVQGTTDTFSYIYKYDVQYEKFHLLQKLASKGAVDIKYFYFQGAQQREHFIVIGNSIDQLNNEIKYETYSIIYKFVNGNFIPFQRLEFYNVRRFLPVLGKNNEFILLVACENQEIKVYQYDGWRFTKSMSYHTGEAFGKGISNMRHIIRNETNLIIVANQHLYGEYINIFSPIYNFKNYLKPLQTGVLEWCEENYERINKIDLTVEEEKLKNLPKLNDNKLVFKNGVEFQNLTASNIETNNIKTSTKTFDKHFFDSMNHISNKILKLEKKIADYEKSQNIVGAENIETNFTNISNQTFSQIRVINEGKQNRTGTEDESIDLEPTDETQNQITFEELIVNGKFNVKFLNKFPFEKLLYTKSNITVDTLKLTNNSLAKAGLYVKNRIDGIKFDASNLLLKTGDQILNGTLSVQNLTVDKLKTKSVNDIEISESSLRNNNTFQSTNKLIVKKLYVKGFVNEIDLKELDQFSLKVNSDQILTESFLFENLTTDSFYVNGLISGKKFGDFVLATNGKSYYIDQDIQFADAIAVNNLEVVERINNIEVIDGRLDVLLKNSEEQQVITGDKIFENVRLLEPILLQGKIASKNIEQMNPVVTINKDITLEGDYIITGDVTVKHLLKSHNMYGTNKKYNVNYLFEKGLQLNSTTCNLNFNFLQPIKTENIFVNIINNHYNVTNFIKLNLNEIQTVTGQKTFINDLVIDGLCDAVFINDVDIAYLNSTILRKYGDQVVEGRTHINRVTALNGDAKTTHIGDSHTLSDFACCSTLSSLDKPYNITVYGNLRITKSLKINHLLTHNNVCNHNLLEMIKDTPLKGENFTVSSDKIFSHSLSVDNLITNGTIFGKRLHEFHNQMDESDNLYYKGNIIFTEEMFIDHIIFNKNLNGISSEEFGNCWLLTELDQSLTQPLIINEISFKRNLQLAGKLNNHDMQYLMDNCLMLNRRENINHGVFVNGVVSHGPVEVHGLINNLNISNAILTNCDTPQMIDSIETKNAVYVNDNIFLQNSINNIKLSNLKVFNDPTNYGDFSEGLIVNGDCKFNQEPRTIFLNHYDIHDLYQNAWMLDDNAIMPHHTIFDDVEFQANIVLKGYFNGIDLQDLADSYFSLTKPQKVFTKLKVKGNIITDNNVTSDYIHLDGLIKSFKSDTGIEIEKYNQLVLNPDEDQTITGEWEIETAHVIGNIKDILINNRNFPDDFILNENNITFPSQKTFQNVIVNNLKCKLPCIIQDVDIFEWMDESISTQGVNTANETISVSGIEINHLFYHSTINGIDFKADKIFTKSTNQTINANISVVSGPWESGITDSIMIRNLFAKEINSVSLNFTENIAHETINGTIVETQINFVQPFVVEHLDVQGTLFDTNLSNENNIEGDDALIEYYKLKNKLDFYEEVGLEVMRTMNNQAYYLRHFIIRHTIIRPILKIVSVQLIYGESFIESDCIAVLELEQKWPIVKFYKYDQKLQKTIIDNNFKSLKSKDFPIINIDRIYLNDLDLLFVETVNEITNVYTQSLLAHSVKGFHNVYEFKSETSRKIVSVKLGKKGCLAISSRFSRNVNIKCADFEDGNKQLGSKQVLDTDLVIDTIPLRNNYISSLVLLTAKGKIEIWIENNQMLSLEQIIEIFNPICITGITYERYNYIGVVSQSTNTSIHHGSIEIYRSPENGNYYHYQTIHKKLPKSIEFSCLPTGELVIYILTDNQIQSLIVYRYAGFAGFKQFVVSSTLMKGDQLSVLKDKTNRLEFIAITDNKKSVILEAVME